MATLESVIQKINLLIEDANDTTGSLHNNLRDAVDSLILGYGNIEVDSLAEIHVWSKYTIGGSIIDEQVTNVQLFWKLSSSTDIFEIDYADSYEIVDNAISLVNPTTITLGRDSESRNAIKGKYVKRGYVYYIPTDAKVIYGNYTTNKTIEVDKATKITYTAGDSEFICIVAAEDINAYPQNGTQGGYKYVYNGTLGDTSSVPLLQSKSVTPSEATQTVTPDSGYDGLSSVSVAGDADLVASNIKKGVSIFNVTGTYGSEPSLQNKSVTPSAKNQVVVPDTNYDGLAQVTVAGDADLVAGNIKKGVDIFGVTGTYECEEGTIVNEDIEVDSLSKLHAWNKYTIVGGTVTETELTEHRIAFAESGVASAPVDYADTYSVAGDGISLDNPTTLNLLSSSNRDIIKGKYIYSHYYKAYFYVPADASLTTHSISAGQYVKASKVTQLTYSSADVSVGEFVSIVVSDDSNAYPQNGDQGGYKYVYRGTLDGFGGDFTVTDGGVGNVTITSSAITDNDGDVVIA